MKYILTLLVAVSFLACEKQESMQEQTNQYKKTNIEIDTTLKKIGGNGNFFCSEITYCTRQLGYGDQPSIIKCTDYMLIDVNPAINCTSGSVWVTDGLGQVSIQNYDSYSPYQGGTRFVFSQIPFCGLDSDCSQYTVECYDTIE